MKLLTFLSLCLCVFAVSTKNNKNNKKHKFNKEFKQFRNTCGDKNSKSMKRRGCSKINDDGSVNFVWPTEPIHLENLPHVVDMGEMVNADGVLVRGFLMPLRVDPNLLKNNNKHRHSHNNAFAAATEGTNNMKEGVEGRIKEKEAVVGLGNGLERTKRRLRHGCGQYYGIPCPSPSITPRPTTVRPTARPSNRPTDRPTDRPTEKPTEGVSSTSSPQTTSNVPQEGCWSCVGGSCPIYPQKSGFEIYTYPENVDKVERSIKMWKDIIADRMPLDDCANLPEGTPKCGDAYSLNYPDGVNMITDVQLTRQDGSCDGATLGVTALYATSDRIIETDIALNTCFNFGDADVGLNPGEMDYISVLTHEIGHALGLGHSNLDPRGCEAVTGRKGREEIMYYAYTGVYRQLWGGDIQGIKTLYP